MILNFRKTGLGKQCRCRSEEQSNQGLHCLEEQSDQGLKIGGFEFFLVEQL